MMTKLLIPILLCGFLTFSCKKDDVEEPEMAPCTEGNANYYPLTIGNYWIYQRHNVDEFGNVLSVGTMDSVFIEKDTVINGKTYFNRKTINLATPTHFNPPTYIRDSVGYLVNDQGSILFSSVNFTDTLNTYSDPNFFETFYTMVVPTQPIVVPAGTFDCLNYRGDVNPLMTPLNWTPPRYEGSYYAENIGKVMSYAFFWSSSSGEVQEQLIRYQVN